MIEYIYFVKCHGCEDEHFYFFSDAKECAMNQLTKKPIITQTEVNRNDFGECTDSCDLGTVWSWEEVMGETNEEPTESVFTKDDLEDYIPEEDSEFDNIDNSLDSEIDEVSDTARKPVPSGMTVEQLVEEMEENEDVVECKNCYGLFDKKDCDYGEEAGGWWCKSCQIPDPITEAFAPDEVVNFDYTNLTITVFGHKRAEDDWDEFEHTDAYTYTKTKSDVATDIWENFITEEDVTDVPGGLNALEDDMAWNDFLETHFDILLDKYYTNLLDYYEEAATEEFQEKYNAEYEEAEYADRADRAYDEYKDTRLFNRPFLEELEEADDYKARLAACPECGADQAFDHETGICINCGFNI